MWIIHLDVEVLPFNPLLWKPVKKYNRLGCSVLLTIPLRNPSVMSWSAKMKPMIYGCEKTYRPIRSLCLVLRCPLNQMQSSWMDLQRSFWEYNVHGPKSIAALKMRAGCVLISTHGRNLTRGYVSCLFMEFRLMSLTVRSQVHTLALMMSLWLVIKCFQSKRET